MGNFWLLQLWLVLPTWQIILYFFVYTFLFELGSFISISPHCAYTFPLFMIICYFWQQYVITSAQGILQEAIEQLKKIPLKEQRGAQERLHLKSLRSKIEGDQDVSFLQSFLSPIQKWADKHLGDYHLHYAEVTTASILLWEVFFWYICQNDTKFCSAILNMSMLVLVKLKWIYLLIAI